MRRLRLLGLPLGAASLALLVPLLRSPHAPLWCGIGCAVAGVGGFVLLGGRGVEDEIAREAGRR